eukprot:TRINITY_DN14341_c0_g1_i2.p1 TRINITY_DN14341_c0_g1~~TRINITY_DN14341_c0_g1_i2.p1  ORF type:complete len:353 (-),score=17.50 TRINITY_DN14341_c0_g1_i2:35-1018(-)
MVSAGNVALFYERVFDDDDTKDVEIEMSDGKLLAHSTILSVGSQALRGILKNAVQEGGLKRLTWKEHGQAVGRVLLRLLYTGTIDEKDWNGSATANTCDETPDQLQIKVTKNGQPLSALGLKLMMTGGNQSVVGTYARKPGVLVHGKPVWERAMLCRLQVFKKQQSTFGWEVVTLDVHQKTSDAILRTQPGTDIPWPHQAQGWRFESRPEGGDPPPVHFSEPEEKIPLEVLAGCLCLVRMYVFEDFLEPILQALERRVCLETFDAICTAAIKTDTPRLRLFCVKFAKDYPAPIRELKDQGKLAPEVCAELIGLWPPERPNAKRRRSF